MTIRDGGSKSDQLIARLSGAVIPPIFSSTQNRLQVQFRSNFQYVYTGFKGTVTVGKILFISNIKFYILDSVLV